MLYFYFIYLFISKQATTVVFRHVMLQVHWDELSAGYTEPVCPLLSSMYCDPLGNQLWETNTLGYYYTKYSEQFGA